jgi:hypothetical protein
MSLPAIWQTPLANAFIKHGNRSFIDGDTVSIPFTFLRDVYKVRYIKGKAPFGVNAEATGLFGTMTRLDLDVSSLPRDYTLTVRAHTNATPDELDAGLPAEWYEERTFTIRGGLWYDPPAGALTKQDEAAYQRGNNVNIQFSFDPGRSPPKNLKLIGGALPPGLTFSLATQRLSGTLAALPKDQLSYPMLFRAWTDGEPVDQFQDRSFDFRVDPVDERHGWDTTWLDSLEQVTIPGYNFTIYSLGTVYRGSTVQIQLQIDNPDGDPLTYKVTGFPIIDGQENFQGVPEGLRVDADGRLVGTPTVAEDAPGAYYFKVYAREPSGTEGLPRTSELVFRVILSSEIQLDQLLNDSVKWLTPAGSIGSTYETFFSHFGVNAVPQFDLTKRDSEYQTVRFSLVGTNPLPSGITLQSDTGYIIGQMPHVTADTTYTFKIRARVVFINKTTGVVRDSTTYSDRQFSFTIKNLYYSDNTSNLYIAVPPMDRAEIAQWVYGIKGEFKDSDPRAPSLLTIVGRDVLFRLTDPAWGRVEQPRILLVGGLLTPSPQEMLTALADYHHKIELRIGQLKHARGVDPSGNYTYDVLYFTVIDPLEGAGGFTNAGDDDILPFNPARDHSATYTGKFKDPDNSFTHRDRYKNWRYTKPTPELNMPSNPDRYQPMSIANARNDLINVATREAWPDNPFRPESAGERGIGIPGTEGLPFWMSCEQTKGKPSSRIGYIPAIELAYLKPGKGAQAVKSLIQSGFQEALQGRPITVDRYLLIGGGTFSTVFDSGVGDGLTTFDGPDCDPATLVFTAFDEASTLTSKYYKFPPGDI